MISPPNSRPRNEDVAEAPSFDRDHADAFAASQPFLRARVFFTELVGVFALVVVDCGGAMIAALSHDRVTAEARSLATGLLITALVYTMGDVSGAHFNPAVTLAFTLRGVFPWKRVPLYWLAQIGGALLASLLLRSLFGDVEHLGATLPGFGASRAFAMEVILTAILVSVALGTATRHRVLGPNAALAAGSAVALCSLFSRPVSGASMNPARSLGPALVSGTLEHLWIYLIAPLAGAALATGVMHIVHYRKHAAEEKAACGEHADH